MLYLSQVDGKVKHLEKQKYPTNQKKKPTQLCIRKAPLFHLPQVQEESHPSTVQHSPTWCKPFAESWGEGADLPPPGQEMRLLSPLSCSVDAEREEEVGSSPS